jgi:TP901-1 family phage major tail protein
MTAYKGALVLLKVADSSGLVESYTTIGGMRTTRFVLNNQVIDATNKSSGKWRELLPEAGISSITIAGTGIFTNAKSEEKIRRYAFENLIRNYTLCFGNGDKLIGPFQITSYERIGNYNEEESYAITLESAGDIKFVIASELPV